MRSPIVRSLLCVALTAWSVTSVSLAEDTKGKWQFGFGLSYFAVTDYIRSNSDLAFADDVVGGGGGEGLPNVGAVDERPDINMLNQPTIQDNFKLDFSASYGLTRWFALEATLGYQKSPVGNIEYYNNNETRPVNDGQNTFQNSCGSFAEMNQQCWEYPSQDATNFRLTTFLPVGDVTRIPINLSGIVRFRPESPLDPYIGLGIGYVLTDLKTGDEFDAKSQDTSAFDVSVGCKGEYTSQNCAQDPRPAPFKIEPLSASVRNSLQWHAVSGVDYYMNERFSVYADARYVWNTGSIDIRTDGVHQVRLGVQDVGKLVIKCDGGNEHCNGPNPDPAQWVLWEDTLDLVKTPIAASGVVADNYIFHNLCPDCRNTGLLETEDKYPGTGGDVPTQNRLFETQEDDGILYQVLPGSFDLDESMIMRDDMGNEKVCEPCRGNNILDTEDMNNNAILDRYLKYGVDICSTAEGVGNPICGGQMIEGKRYVWPEGCNADGAMSNNNARGTQEGCPPFALANQRTNLGRTSADDASDVFIIQGGRIRLGGFSLGAGFKFTF